MSEEFRIGLDTFGDITLAPDGTLETVAAKIATTSRALRLSRFDIKYSAGTLPHDTLMKSIELIGTEVAPRVRELMAASETTRR
jgi:hypothetical protein